MNSIANPIDILEKPEVKRFLLAVLESDLPSEYKYYRFVELFRRLEALAEKMPYENQAPIGDEDEIDRIVSKVVSKAAQQTNIWNPERIIQQTEDSIIRAIQRLKNSQYDGGWGFRFNQCECWGTGHALLCLDSAKRNLGELGLDLLDIDRMLKGGIDWLYRNRWSWAVEDVEKVIIPLNERIFVYELSLVVVCFYRIGKGYFTEEFSWAIFQCIKRLILCQNNDGGWEEAGHRVFGHRQLRTESSSEVGATSWALRALAAQVTSQGACRAVESAIERAVNWLIRAQNEGGGWNYDFQGEYTASISKTCDALQGIIAGMDLNIADRPKEQISRVIDQGIEWLKSQEKLILRDRKIEGTGWMHDGDDSFDIENTCLTLETLVKMSEPFLPLLNSSAEWLVMEQYKEDEERAEDPESVGKWDRELTARVTYSLIEYYKRIKESPLFGIEPEHDS